MKLIEAINYLNDLKTVADKVYPARMRYAITRNILKISAETELAEKSRIEICGRYAAKDEDGNPLVKDGVYICATDEDAKARDEEVRALYDTDVDIDILKIQQQDLEECDLKDRYDIPSIAEVMALDFMIEQ